MTTDVLVRVARMTPIGNSRTCFAARSARRDDCRRDVGRNRAKKAAKMNVGSYRTLHVTVTRSTAYLAISIRRNLKTSTPVPPPKFSPSCPRAYAGRVLTARAIHFNRLMAELSSAIVCGYS
jgi:hypothetical protein